MSTLTIAIVVVFCVGYLFIALESVTKVNKAAVALLMFVVCWTLFMIDPGSYLPGFSGQELINKAGTAITEHLGDTSTTLFFLMGAMTKRTLLWRIAFLTFFLSAILDNLTTSIVMIMILRKLVKEHKDRIIYASLVIIAANSGGAFSPIGDVTTIMLWNKLSEITIPSIVSMVIPAFILQYSLHGDLEDIDSPDAPLETEEQELGHRQRAAVFCIGVGGLMFVPVFKGITGLPPFVGIMLVLSVLWIATELFYRNLATSYETHGTKKRVVNLLHRIDMSTILFFLGILMAVASLEQTGVLTSIGKGLNIAFDGNHYAVTGIIGVLSSMLPV